MNELERIVREASRPGDAFLLATVVRVEGSSYRRPGARMLVAGDRWVSGCVSGGCLEGDVMLRGAHRCRDGPVVVTYDSTSDDAETSSGVSAPRPDGLGALRALGVRLGCNGIVDVLLEHVAAGTDNDAITFARACFAAERVGTLVTVIGGPRHLIGARVAVGPACTLTRSVEDPALRDALDAAAHGPTGVIELADHGVTVLVEVIAPSAQLFVLGSGHDAAPLVALAQAAGFRVTVADRAIREHSRFIAADRVLAHGGELGRVRELIDAGESYVVIMHHHEAADRDALAMALASRARYVGVLGPARRTRDLLAELSIHATSTAPSAGPPRELRSNLDTGRLHAPIGLDIGAETPEQIALSIIGEVQAVAAGARGGMLRDRTRALHADIAIAVLAAGASRRLGRPKQLVELDGAPLVRRVASAAVATRSGPVGVVLGANAAAVAHALGELRVAQVANDGWQEGIASSIRAAVAWAETTHAGALVIALADQALTTAAHLAALRDAWLAGAPIAASRFRRGATGSRGGNDSVVGAPAIFDRSRWPELAALTGDQGAARLVLADDVVAIDWDGGAVDVDTPEDLQMLQQVGAAPLAHR